MQLTSLAAALVLGVALGPGLAHADGTVTVRGAYYKERSTRVTQPMVDADLEVGEHGRLQGHVLIDSITSASVAAGADGNAFNERRYEAGATYVHELDRYRLGAGGRVSSEPDYGSALARVIAEMDLAQRNTTLGLGLAYGHDEISNAGATGGLAPAFAAKLDTLLLSTSISQVLSPTSIAALTYDLAYLDGYQANPYRSVIAGGSAQSERVPGTRLRHALFGSVRSYFPATRTTAIAGYRFYADDWGIVAHTPELRLVEDVAPGLQVALRYRLHLQDAADFYDETYDTANMLVEPYLTEDDKLSEFSTQTFGAKLDVKLELLGAAPAWHDTRLQAILEYVAQTTHFGDAIVAELALIVPLDY